MISRCVASNTIGSQRREKQSEPIKIDVSGEALEYIVMNVLYHIMVKILHVI